MSRQFLAEIRAKAATLHFAFVVAGTSGTPDQESRRHTENLAPRLGVCEVTCSLVPEGPSSRSRSAARRAPACSASSAAEVATDSPSWLLPLLSQLLGHPESERHPRRTPLHRPDGVHPCRSLPSAETNSWGAIGSALRSTSAAVCDQNSSEVVVLAVVLKRRACCR